MYGCNRYCVCKFNKMEEGKRKLTPPKQSKTRNKPTKVPKTRETSWVWPIPTVEVMPGTGALAWAFAG